MFSLLRPSLIYTDISPEIVHHDVDADAEEWVYDQKTVLKGSADPNYTQLNVYWLYDDNSKRIGLAEHEIDSPEIFKALWFYDKNPFATLFQDPGWISTDQTLWSMLSNEAYQDSLEHDFTNPRDDALKSNVLLITPEMFTKDNFIYECSKCGKKSFSEMSEHSTMKKVVDFTNYSPLFLDDSFVLFKPSPKFTWPRELLDASVQEQKAPEPEQAGQGELQSDHHHRHQPHQHLELHHPPLDSPPQQPPVPQRSPSSEHAQVEIPELPVGAT